MDRALQFILTPDAFLRSHIMHGGEKLQPRRGLESTHELRHTIEALTHLGILSQNGVRLPHGSLQDFQERNGRIAVMGAGFDERPLDLAQQVGQVLAYGP